MDKKLTREDVEILAKETPFKGYFQIDHYQLRHRTFAGGWTAPMSREIFERGHAVGVLLYDPERDRVGLIEQFRPGAYAAGWNPWLIEVVAGIIEEGEDLEDVARREVQEEAGCEVVELVDVAHFLVTPGGSSETLKLYCARVDSSAIAGLHGLAHEGEDIRVFTLSTDEALAMVKDGRINNSTAMIALMWLATERENLKTRWGVQI